MELNLEALLKLWGPLGLLVGVLILLIWKKLLPFIEAQQAENRAVLTSALEDARRDRDAMRQLREKEVDKFLESLRFRDERFSEIAEAIKTVRRTRQ